MQETLNSVLYGITSREVDNLSAYSFLISYTLFILATMLILVLIKRQVLKTTAQTLFAYAISIVISTIVGIIFITSVWNSRVLGKAEIKQLASLSANLISIDERIVDYRLPEASTVSEDTSEIDTLDKFRVNPVVKGNNYISEFYTLKDSETEDSLTTKLQNASNVQVIRPRISSTFKNEYSSYYEKYITSEMENALNHTYFLYSIDGVPIYEPSKMDAKLLELYQIYFPPTAGNDLSKTVALSSAITVDKLLDKWGSTISVATADGEVVDVCLENIKLIPDTTCSLVYDKDGDISEFHCLKGSNSDKQITINNNVEVNTDPTDLDSSPNK